MFWGWPENVPYNELRAIFCFTGIISLLNFPVYFGTEFSRWSLRFSSAGWWPALCCTALSYLFLKRPRVISAFMCLRSQLDTVSSHLPIIYDIWQVHKHPCVPVLYVSHFRVHPRMQRKQGCRWLRAPLEGISDNGFGKEIMDTLPLLQWVNKNSDCIYEWL